MATYDNDLRLKEITTGDEDGTWGTSTNLNLELIGEALSYGTQDCFASDADATTTVADSATDPARSMYFKVTSSATLTATRTLTIAPNTISRVMWIENATTGSQSITISQGSGGNVTIPTGDVKVVYLDGAGSGAAVVDAFTNLNLADVSSLVATTVDINGGSIDGTIIGAASPAAGTFTTATATTGAITTVNSTTVNATTVDATSVEVTNVKAKDGTASATIADSTGVMTISSSVLTTADINGGTIDGTVIGGTTPAAINGTVVTGTTSGVFASDMTITAGSIVSASGAITFGNENLVTTGTLGAGATTVTTFTSTGIDDNGTATAITIDSSQNVGIGTGSPTRRLSLVNLLADPIMTIRGAANNTGSIFFGDDGDDYIGQINYDHSTNAMEFVTSATERMRIDSSGNIALGGGTINGGANYISVDINAGTVGSFLRLNAASGVYHRLINNGADLSINADDGNTGASTHIYFNVDGNTAMEIDSSGNVGIGTASPASALHVDKNIAAPAVTIHNTGGASAAYAGLEVETSTTGTYVQRWVNAGTELMRVTGTGNVGINWSAPSAKLGIVGSGSVTPSISVTDGATSDIEFFPGYASGVARFGSSAGALVATAGGTVCWTATGANLAVAGALSKGSGSFKIDHPLKPDTHHLVHSFVESPQADLYYRGKVSLVDGAATVNIDEAAGMTEGTFVALCRDVQCFTSNEESWTNVRGSVSGNILTIEAQDSSCTDLISWLVVGERKDPHMYDTDWTDDEGRVIVEPEKQKMT
jgi:hypothetical protein